MKPDFCIISTGLWTVIWIVSLLWGAFLGCVLQWLVSKIAPDLAEASIANFSGGCLLPVFGAILSAWAVSRWLPDDPCGGAFTADAQFVPVVVCFAVSLAAFMPLLIRIWRR